MPLWGKTDSTASMPKSITGGSTDNVLFEDMSSVYMDAFPGLADPSNRPGWYFTNLVKGNKINWYFFSNTEATIKLGETSYYALITLDGAVDRPFLAMYTAKEGAGDAASWYRSRVVSSMPSVTLGTKYLVHVGAIPDSLFPGIPRIAAVNTGSTVGPRGANETVLTIAIGSNSAASAGNVKFVCEAAGVISPNYIKNSIFRIRSTYSPETDTGEVSEIVPQEAANLYLVDPQEAELAKEKGITGPGWWTYKTYTTSTGVVRHKAECLVPMKVQRSESGDRGADDLVLPNGKVTITSQPVNASVSVGSPFTFSVVANADGASLTYQWQESANGTTFTNISGATSSSYSASATALKDGYKYKVVVSSTGLVSATSNVVTLSVA